MMTEKSKQEQQKDKDQPAFSYFPCYGNLDPRTQAHAYHFLQQQRLRQLQQQEKFIMPQSTANLGSNSIDYSALTSFLDVDDTFLTTWNWNPDDAAKKNGPTNFGRNPDVAAEKNGQTNFGGNPDGAAEKNGQTNFGRNPDGAAEKNGPTNSGRKRRMYFEPGSFFSSSDQLPKQQ